MKIDPVSGYQTFRAPSGTAAAKAASQEQTGGKTDVAEFSRGQTPPPDKTLLTLKSGILRDIGLPAGPQELSALKENIRQGSYRPSTDQMVDAILGRL